MCEMPLSNVGSPVTLNNAGSAPARAYLAAAERLKGKQPRRTPAAKKDCSADSFGGEPHELAELFQSAALGSSRPRTSPASSRARAHRIPRVPGSFGTASGRDLAGHRQARCGGLRKGKGQLREARRDLDARDRDRDTDTFERAVVPGSWNKGCLKASFAGRVRSCHIWLACNAPRSRKCRGASLARQSRTT